MGESTKVNGKVGESYQYAVHSSELSESKQFTNADSQNSKAASPKKRDKSMKKSIQKLVEFLRNFIITEIIREQVSALCYLWSLSGLLSGLELDLICL